MTHPAVIENLSKNGTVVIFFVPDCPEHGPAMITQATDLQSQYPEVTFASFKYEDKYDNSTVRAMYKNYDIDRPTVIVIRSDGASAKFIGDSKDVNPIKSAIEDAQIWHKAHRTPTP